MPKAALILLWLAAAAQAPAVPAGRFAGVWVGTQGWAIANPPPGARADQPVTLTIEVAEGRIGGTLKPFLGGEEGATLVNASVVGNELRATAVVGTPRAPGARRGANWKDTVAVDLVMTLDGVSLKGKADVTMSEVPWLAFSYDLSRKRSRY
jgi:hypothetical protein